MALIGVALCAFVALLFYRWVERPHKIAFFKIVGAIAALMAIAVTVRLWQIR